MLQRSPQQVLERFCHGTSPETTVYHSVLHWVERALQVEKIMIMSRPFV